MRSSTVLLGAAGAGFTAAAALPRRQQNGSDLVQRSSADRAGANVHMVSATPKERSGSIPDIRKYSIDARIESLTNLRDVDSRNNGPILEARRGGGGSGGGGAHGGGGSSSGGRGGGGSAAKPSTPKPAAGGGGGGSSGKHKSGHKSGSWSRKKKIGVGAGVGGGGAALIGLGGGGYYVHRRNKRKSKQNTVF